MGTCTPWVVMTARHTWPPWRSMSPRCIAHPITMSSSKVLGGMGHNPRFWPSVPPKGSAFYIPPLTLRYPTKSRVYMVAGLGGPWWVCLQPVLLSLQVNSWTPVASMLSRRSSAGVAVLEGALYVAGGNDGTSCLNSVERYSTKAGAWESVAPMNIRRCIRPGAGGEWFCHYIWFIPGV